MNLEPMGFGYRPLLKIHGVRIKNGWNRSAFTQATMAIGPNHLAKSMSDLEAMRFFTELIEDAHTNNHSVILDFVANHVHEEHPLIINHPDWKTPFYLKDSVPNIRIWDAQRLTTWFDPFLPTLDLENPEVRKNQVDSAAFWMENFDLDGFRHDATKHIPYSFWEDLTQKDLFAEPS